MTPPRSGKELIAATRPFATERPSQSAYYALSTFALIALAEALTLFARPIAVRAVLAVATGLLLVRGFILYHDAMHGALLRASRAWRAVFNAYGVLVLTPPSVWRQTHNYHHAHTAKIVGSHVGSFPMLTTDLWRRASAGQRLAYRLVRHPLNVLAGYATIFLYGMCVAPLARAPRRHWDAALALAVHGSLGWLLWRWGGASALAFGLLLPLATACAVGSYLFYAQHNFPEVEVQPRERWEYSRAALESSSYMPMGPFWTWLTGNIGYHHVHHLNPSIPFYRLPEAMAGVPELQHPRTTTLAPADIAACFRLALWDPAAGRMVSFREAADSRSRTERTVTPATSAE